MSDIKDLSISAVRSLLAAEKSVGDELLGELDSDPREGIRQLAATVRNRRERKAKQEAITEKLLKMERGYHARGMYLVAGVDEAGRGPLAGPVVAAAVIMPEKPEFYPAVRDSKTLSHDRREELFDQVHKVALAVGVGLADHRLIDSINIYQAAREAMFRAVGKLGVEPEVLLIDGPLELRMDVIQKAVIKGDATCYSIAAASVIAKVTRDRMMLEYDREYPGYGFSAHKGYGTADHMAALKALGPCPIHRRSFAVVSQSENKYSEQCAFFIEGFEKAGSLDELDAIADGIKQIKESLSEEDLKLLRTLYKKTRNKFK